MALTEQKRTTAHEMFSTGADTKTVARRIRMPVASVAALKANWTRQQSASSTTPARSSRSNTSTSSSSSTTQQPVIVRLNSSRLKNALANGQPVQVLIEV